MEPDLEFLQIILDSWSLAEIREATEREADAAADWLLALSQGPNIDYLPFYFRSLLERGH